jgi:Zn-dependent metalloprotease
VEESKRSGIKNPKLQALLGMALALPLFLSCIASARASASTSNIKTSNTRSLNMKSLEKFTGLSRNQMRLESTHGAENHLTHRFSIKHEGLEILGGDLLVHQAEGPFGQKLHELSGFAKKNLSIATSPRLSESQIKAIALSALAEYPKAKILSTNLVVDALQKNSLRLAYLVKASLSEFEGESLVIDAENGALRMRWPLDHSMSEFGGSDFKKRRKIYSETARKSVLCSQDAQKDCSNQPTFQLSLREGGKPQDVDSHVAHAYRHLGQSFDFFASRFGRNSFDDRGSPLIARVFTTGVYFASAWNTEKKEFVFGRGYGLEMKNFGEALDVVGHEFTHAVIHSTSKLIPHAESGALAESFADFFGKRIAHSHMQNQGEDWTFGKDAFVSHAAKRGFRHLKHPSLFNHPEYYQERVYKDVSRTECNRFNDYCGIHSNAGIANRIATRLLEKWGQAEDIERLYYVTMTQYLSPYPSFQEARAQMLKACEHLALSDSDFSYDICALTNLTWEEAGVSSPQKRNPNRVLSSASL